MQPSSVRSRDTCRKVTSGKVQPSGAKLLLMLMNENLILSKKNYELCALHHCYNVHIAVEWLTSFCVQGWLDVRQRGNRRWLNRRLHKHPWKCWLTFQHFHFPVFIYGPIWTGTQRAQIRTWKCRGVSFSVHRFKSRRQQRPVTASWK